MVVGGAEGEGGEEGAVSGRGRGGWFTCLLMLVRLYITDII
jgi:hypothetical protein